MSWRGGLAALGAAAALLLAAYQAVATWRRASLAADRRDVARAAARPDETGPLPESPSSPLPAETVPAGDDGLRQELEQAAAALTERLGEKPDVLAILGAKQDWQGQADQAAETWKKCLALDPRQTEAYLGLARLAERQGAADETAERARKALELDARSGEAVRLLAHALVELGRFTDAVDVLQAYLRTEPPPDAAAVFLLGHAHLQMEEFDKAQAMFLRAVQLYPEYTHAYYGLATVCARLGREEECQQYRTRFDELKQRDRATGSYVAMVALAPNEMRRGAAELSVAMGRAYVRHGQAAHAVPLWRKAAAYDAQNIASRELLVAYYQRERQPAEALRLSEELCALRPDEMRYRLAAAQQRFALGRWDEAETGLLDVCRRAPQHADGHATLAQFYLRVGRNLSAAVAHSRRAVELAPTAPHYFLLGTACEAVGDRAGATVALAHAVELEPNQPRFREAYDALKNGP